MFHCPSGEKEAANVKAMKMKTGNRFKALETDSDDEEGQDGSPPVTEIPWTKVEGKRSKKKGRKRSLPISLRSSSCSSPYVIMQAEEGRLSDEEQLLQSMC